MLATVLGKNLLGNKGGGTRTNYLTYSMQGSHQSHPSRLAQSHCVDAAGGTIGLPRISHNDKPHRDLQGCVAPQGIREVPLHGLRLAWVHHG